jgi:hypothetical protein
MPFVILSEREFRSGIRIDVGRKKLLWLQDNKTGKVSINVTIRRTGATIFTVEKQ